MLWLQLLACAPVESFAPVEDRWSETIELCEERTPECEAALEADFGTDLASFSDDRLEVLHQAAWDLLTRDRLRFDDLYDIDEVFPVVIEAAGFFYDLHGADENRQLFYNLAAHHIQRSVGDASPDLNAAFSFSDHTLWIDVGINDLEAPQPFYGAAILLHEASHDFVPGHQPCPHDERFSCDIGASGAYAFTAAGIAAALGACDDAVESCGTMESYLESTMERIATD